MGPGQLRKHRQQYRAAKHFRGHLDQIGVVGNYAAAQDEIVVHEVSGVPIPFASPALLLRMKSGSVRDKDRADVAFLRRLAED